MPGIDSLKNHQCDLFVEQEKSNLQPTAARKVVELGGAHEGRGHRRPSCLWHPGEGVLPGEVPTGLTQVWLGPVGTPGKACRAGV